ncbi:hypothetical protein V7089_12140 [Neobacillus drentensis]
MIAVTRQRKLEVFCGISLKKGEYGKVHRILALIIPRYFLNVKRMMT